MPEQTPDLTPTGGQTVGPFFAYALLYDGCDQLVPPGSPGAIRLHGHVYDGAGEPVPDALVEIRQADPSGTVPVAEGSYRRGGFTFTGWGRSGTDPAGHYGFTTLEPGARSQSEAPFFAVTVFARGLLNRLFTRIYLPDNTSALEQDPFLGTLDEQARATVIAHRDGPTDLRFDIHLQGDRETVFLTYPRHQ